MRPSPTRVADRYAGRFQFDTPVAWDIEHELMKFMESQANSRVDIGKPIHDRPYRNDRSGLHTIRGTFRTDNFWEDTYERLGEKRRIQSKVQNALRRHQAHIADVEVRYIVNGQWGIRVQFIEPEPSPS